MSSHEKYLSTQHHKTERCFRHIGPWVGNLGDAGSHWALSSTVSDLISGWTYERREVRDLYFHGGSSESWSNLLENGQGLNWIGGGALLDPSWPKSISGTTLNFDPTLLTPTTVLFGVGMFTPRSWDTTATDRLRDWLLRAHERTEFIYVRNDGSLDAFCDAIQDDELKSFIKETCDPALMAALSRIRPTHLGDSSEIAFSNRHNQRPYILLALAGDEPDRRRRFVGSDPHPETLLKDLLAETTHDIVIVCHTLADLTLAGRLVSGLTAVSARKRIRLTGSDWTNPALPDIFELYKGAEVVISSRLHGVIFSLAVGTAVLPICSHRALHALSQNYGLESFSMSNLRSVPDSNKGERFMEQVENDANRARQVVRNVVNQIVK